MARRRVKKTVKESAPTKEEKQPQIEEPNQFPLIDQEVERQIVAIRAIRDVGIEHLLTELRLMRSYFIEEQLKTPVLQFFKENLPNLTIERNEENGEFLVKRNDSVDGLSDGGNINASLLSRLSLAYPSCSANLSVGGFGLASNAGKTSIFGAADNLQMPDFGLECQSDSQMLGMHDGLQTPGLKEFRSLSFLHLYDVLLHVDGNSICLFKFRSAETSKVTGMPSFLREVSSQRLSIGMTPKTQRLPKPGEMLLSVRGSPLGVFKEENMEAIHESEED